LFPTGIGGTAYTATKYAVVGLSVALRAEAADLGVRVSVACPGVTRSGILDATTYVNVEPDAARSRAMSFRMMEASQCARVILHGVARNRAIIPITGLTRAGWWLYRLSPGLYDRLAQRMAREFRSALRRT
jgi:short-subunit dehydrogenase